MVREAGYRDKKETKAKKGALNEQILEPREESIDVEEDLYGDVGVAGRSDDIWS